MPHRHSTAKSMTTAPVVRNGIAKRRSNRMSLNASVGLSGHDRHKASFTVNAKALNLNKHGAAVQLHHELPVGSTVVMRNRVGVQVSARVVAQISAVEGVRTYGIEFLEQDEKAKLFWGITFPTS
jgi:hypothetical protein